MSPQAERERARERGKKEVTIGRSGQHVRIVSVCGMFQLRHWFVVILGGRETRWPTDFTLRFCAKKQLTARVLLCKLNNNSSSYMKTLSLVLTYFDKSDYV